MTLMMENDEVDDENDEIDDDVYADDRLNQSLRICWFKVGKYHSLD